MKTQHKKIVVAECEYCRGTFWRKRPWARFARPRAFGLPQEEALQLAKKAVDGLSRSLQSRFKLVESPFPPRNQTCKQTFWAGTRKPNSGQKKGSGLEY